MWKKLISFAFLVFLLHYSADAVIAPRSVGNEKRIKIWAYSPNKVFKYVGHYEYQSIIEFAPDEEIENVTMGTPTPWQIHPIGNRIFIKPVEDDASTNMTVITNKRMYFFEMHAEEAKDVSDENLSFITKMVYPGQNRVRSVSNQISNKNSGTSAALKKIIPYSGADISNICQDCNCNYTISGKNRAYEPLMIFDNGEFTYFKFRNINADIPAIFLVDSEQRESLINYRIAGEYVVVERVAAKFTLRYGNSVICVFNESYDDFNNVDDEP